MKSINKVKSNDRSMNEIINHNFYLMLIKHVQNRTNERQAVHAHIVGKDAGVKMKISDQKWMKVCEFNL